MPPAGPQPSALNAAKARCLGFAARVSACLAILVLLTATGWGGETNVLFQGSIQPLPDRVRAGMDSVSYRDGCPVSPDDLVLVRLNHWNMNGGISMGELVVHRRLAGEVLEIFGELFDRSFPIARVRLIEEYGGSDEASMIADNTSAFNCRPVTGGTRFSRHSYGAAVDVNPVENPYVKGDEILPPAGSGFLDRSSYRPGMIVPGGPCHDAFTRRGWTWGGEWSTLKDYMHFEKRLE